MNMPTPCPICNEIVELDDMRTVGRGRELYCEECCEELEGGSDE